MKSSLYWLSGLLVATMGWTNAFMVRPASSLTRGAVVVGLRMSEEPTSLDASASAAQEELPKPAAKCPNCDLCDGSGRIEGGIGTVLTWWPIKAYRPCPNFIESGGFYQRSGQGLDEIAFGRDSTFDSDK